MLVEYVQKEMVGTDVIWSTLKISLRSATFVNSEQPIFI